ncbi:MAG: septum formation protein Maf [Bdellovibrionales bacterium]|nr:septum formation protein Maf [Bdellovibrionales bacterium]
MYCLKSGAALILASASPRRKDLLDSLGFPYSIQAADICEDPLPNELPKALVSRLSQEKATVLANRHNASWILAADTMVVCDEEFLGKPIDEQDAVRMLSLLSGRVHAVLGGVTLINQEQGVTLTKIFETRVIMRKFSSAEIRSYVKTQEPFGKAGAYAIQGYAAAFVTEIEGSYTNVVGLDLSGVVEMFQEVGILCD